MKNNKIMFSGLLTGILLSVSISANALYVNFDGSQDGGTNYSGGNVPMPATPSPPPPSNSSNNSQTSSSTHHSKSSSKSSGSLLTPQMRDEIVDSVYKQMLKQQEAAKKQAIEAQKQAEIKKKHEAAKKKKDAMNWLKDYQVDSTPHIKNEKATVKFLDDSDPIGPKVNSGKAVPKPWESNKIPAIEKSPLRKQEEAVMKAVNKKEETKTINKEEDPYALKMTEGEMRAMYYNADREIMQCANGTKDCSVEYVKALQMKRLTAEQGLATHFNYKNVGGNFIKKPN